MKKVPLGLMILVLALMIIGVLLIDPSEIWKALFMACITIVLTSIINTLKPVALDELSQNRISKFISQYINESSLYINKVLEGENKDFYINSNDYHIYSSITKYIANSEGEPIGKPLIEIVKDKKYSRILLIGNSLVGKSYESLLFCQSVKGLYLPLSKFDTKQDVVSNLKDILRSELKLDLDQLFDRKIEEKHLKLLFKAIAEKNIWIVIDSLESLESERQINKVLDFIENYFLINFNEAVYNQYQDDNEQNRFESIFSSLDNTLLLEKLPVNLELSMQLTGRDADFIAQSDLQLPLIINVFRDTGSVCTIGDYVQRKLTELTHQFGGIDPEKISNMVSFLAMVERSKSGLNDFQPRHLPNLTAKLLYYIVSRFFEALLISIGLSLIISGTASTYLPLGTLAYILHLLAYWQYFIKDGANNKIEIRRYILYALVVSAACGLFGSILLRKGEKDYEFDVFSVSSMAYGMLFGLLYATITASVRWYEIKKRKKMDIIPVVLYEPTRDISEPIRNFGAELSRRAYLFSGMFLALIGLTIQVLKPNSDICRWFNMIGLKMDISPFLVSTLLMFGLGYWLTFFLNVLISKPDEFFRTSIIKAEIFDMNELILRGLTVFFLTFSLTLVTYGGCLFVFYGHRIDVFIWRLILLSTGFGLIGLYAQGFKSIIRSICLRVLLWCYDLHPFNRKPFMESLLKTNLIVRTPNNFHFRHEVFSRSPQLNDVRYNLSIRKSAISLAVFLLILSVGWLYVQMGYFWGTYRSDNIFVRVDPSLKSNIQLQNNTLKFNTDALVTFRAHGEITLGDLLGSVSAKGTEVGIFCWPTFDNHDIEGRFRHGCLLVRSKAQVDSFSIKNESVFNSAFPALLDPDFILKKQMHRGDTLQLFINDIETANNRGQFDVLVTSD